MGRHSPSAVDLLGRVLRPFACAAAEAVPGVVPNSILFGMNELWVNTESIPRDLRLLGLYDSSGDWRGSGERNEAVRFDLGRLVCARWDEGEDQIKNARGL